MLTPPHEPGFRGVTKAQNAQINKAFDRLFTGNRVTTRPESSQLADSAKFVNLNTKTPETVQPHQSVRQKRNWGGGEGEGEAFRGGA